MDKNSVSDYTHLYGQTHGFSKRISGITWNQELILAVRGWQQSGFFKWIKEAKPGTARIISGRD